MKAFTFLTALLNVSLSIEEVLPRAGFGCGSESNTFCLNERQFITCDPNVPQEDQKLFTCPFDQFCTDVQGSCTKNPEIPKTSSTICGICSSKTEISHVCTSPRNFEPCFNGIFIKTDLNECPIGSYCDALSENSTFPCSPFDGKQLLCWQPRKLNSDEYQCKILGLGFWPIAGVENCNS